MKLKIILENDNQLDFSEIKDLVNQKIFDTKSGVVDIPFSRLRVIKELEVYEVCDFIKKGWDFFIYVNKKPDTPYSMHFYKRVKEREYTNDEVKYMLGILFQNILRLRELRRLFMWITENINNWDDFKQYKEYFHLSGNAMLSYALVKRDENDMWKSIIVEYVLRGNEKVFEAKTVLPKKYRKPTFKPQDFRIILESEEFSDITFFIIL